MVVGLVVGRQVGAIMLSLEPAPLPFLVYSVPADARLRYCLLLLYPSATAPCDLGPWHRNSRRLH